MTEKLYRVPQLVWKEQPRTDFVRTIVAKTPLGDIRVIDYCGFWWWEDWDKNQSSECRTEEEIKKSAQEHYATIATRVMQAAN